MFARIASQLALAATFVAIVLVAAFVVPGDGRDWSFGNRAQVAVAFSDASLGGIVFSTNVVLNAISAVQGLAFATAAALFLRHWAIIVLSSDTGMTFAALDVVLQNNYIQLARHFWLKPTIQIAVVGFISLFSLVFVRIVDLLVQSTVIDSYGYYPGMSQVYYPNTSSITGNLISFSQTGQYLDTATVSSSLFQSFSESMLAVSKDCPNGVCGSATNSTTPLIDCKVGFANCTAQIPVYTDYYMSCIKTLVPSESDSLDSDISVLVDPASITVDGQVPSVIWNATIKDTANTTVSMNVLCTVLAAWSTRTENSELGTLDKELVTVYDSVSAATNPLIKDANSFNYQANCGKLAAPICQLYILGLVMNAPWNGINSVSGFANWGLNMLAIPVLQNTSATSLEKLAILEACMRFFVEDITKRVILSATASPDALTCTGCAFREARGTRKDLVLTFVGVISGFGFLLMLISVIWTFTKRTSIEFINAIDIAQLPLVSRNVRKQVLESLKPDEDVQFKAKIGILSDVVVEDEIEMAHISEDAGISSQNSWSSDKRKSFMGGLERRSLLVNTLGRDSVSANKRRSGTVGEYNLSMASPPYQSL